MHRDRWQTFHTNPPEAIDLAATAARRDQCLDDLINKFGFRWGFFAEHTDPRFELGDPAARGANYGESYGVTTRNTAEMRGMPTGVNWKVFVFLNTSPLESLLRPDLSAVDHAVIQFNLALTVCPFLPFLTF